MKKALTDSEFSIESGEFSWAEQGLSEAHDYIVPVVSAWLKEAKVKTVLDIGCGNGSLTNELAAAGMEATGIDVSQSGLAIARNSYPHIPFFDGEIESPLPGHLKNGFDAVIASEVIEHLLLPRSLFKRAREALRPGGILVMTTPYHGYLKNLALALTNQFDKHWHPLRDYGHIKFFSARTLLQLAEEEGFRVNRMARAGRIPPLAKSIIIQGILSR